MGNSSFDLATLDFAGHGSSKANYAIVQEKNTRDIAIIGMACRLPMADNPSDFWGNLKNGTDCTGNISQNRRKDIEEYLNFTGLDTDKIKYTRGAFLDEIDKFDCNLFRLSPREAELMNPTQRLFLETAWETIEDAGYGAGSIAGSNTGVYVGYIGDLEGYKYKQMITGINAADAAIALPGNLSSIIPGRISYLLDLKGPAMLVDTACSSSLVAVHLACNAIRNGDCNMAIAGGVRINLLPVETGEKIGIESSDGRTHSFDDSSDGTGSGEGVAAVMLKSLNDAVRNRDNIYAVIKGTAINQDGTSSGITAPNAAAQSDVIIKAWKDAGIDPETISYIEAHGTGTKLGDPIEIEGINEAFKRYTNRKQFCAVGSVKSNIGHLYDSAGIVSLIKAAMMIRNKMMVPSINFSKPNSNIHFEETPVYVNTGLKEWEANGKILRCGVSSFGFSGTNCHLVMEEPPKTEDIPHEVSTGPEILTLSAKTRWSLEELIKKYRDFLPTAGSTGIKDILFTANTGRSGHDFRAALIFDNPEELSEKLTGLSGGLKNAKLAGFFYNDGKIKYRDEESKRQLNKLALDRVKAYKLSGKTDVRMLADICGMYIDGADINWKKFYEREGRNKVSVPAYQFEKKRCWVKIPVKDYLRKNTEHQERKAGSAGRAFNDVRLTGRENGFYTETERTIANAWGCELGYEEININDSFQQLGGDSILAAKVANNLSEKAGTAVNIADVVRYSTISAFAVYMDKTRVVKAEMTVIASAEEMTYYPLSSAQKRLYIMDELQGDELFYNLPYSVKVDGAIDAGRLQEVFNQLVGIHESFRTSFHIIKGEPVQKINAEADLKIEYFKAAGSNIEDIKKNFVRKFDLSKAPLLRVGAVITGKNKFVLLLDMHHIISDGTSMGIILKDFMNLYEKKQILGSAIRYRDYSVWQNSMQKKDDMKKQEEYWLKVFSEKTPELEIPSDFKKPAKQKTDGSKIVFNIEAGTADKLRKLAVKTGSTIYMVLLAAYNIVLSKYTGSEDITVGSPSAGRQKKEFENIVGMFVNTLAMRNYPKNECFFEEFLQSVKENTLDAFDNQDYQFDELVGKLGIKRDRNENPLFNTMFVMQNMDIPKMESTGLKFGCFKSENTAAMFDIVMEIIEGREISANLLYRISRFKAAAMKRFIGHYLNVLKEITENPGIRLSEINIMTGEEEDTIINDFNNTAVDYPKERAAHELFEEQAKRTPDKKALVFEDHAISYDELNKKSNQLAWLLKEKGIQAGDIVAVIAGQSLEMIAGILAVLKAGGAYLPVDPKYPKDRIKYMLKDSGAVLLLTQENLADNYTNDMEVICLDKDETYYGETMNPRSINSMNDPAYVIYTSGSTGMPKGVVAEHKGLLNMIYGNASYFSITSEDNSTKYAGFGFDGSVFEIFPFLTKGATIHIISEDMKLDIKRLNEYFEKNRITIGFLPTQLCEQFMKIENNSLTRLLTAGEKLKYFNKKKYQLYNNYGPTENTVCATCYPVCKMADNIPVGKPLPNVRVYIIGEKTGKLQPIGIPGEICISGDSLTRGYKNRPELTASKFVENPVFPEEKMYKTGDLGRWLPDGNIEFLGRLDNQVKIRGFRIELGEIECKLQKHPLISAAAVIDRDDASGSKYLCAYVVSEKEIDTAGLKEFLLQDLPDYMVPAFIIRIPVIPLNANGKVDKKALPEPSMNICAIKEYEPPGTDMEKELARVWEDILGLKGISVNENFFNLGGNSMKAIQAASKLSANFEVSINDMFLYQTIRELAGKISVKKDNLKLKIDKIKNMAADSGLNSAGGQEFAHGPKAYLESLKKYSNLNPDKRRNYGKVLLTGATGYLGIYLLRDMLLNSHGSMYLFIRAETEKKAAERLKDKLDFYFSDENIFERFEGRLNILNADMTKEYFGLKRPQYDMLAAEIDCVINAAANVRHYGRYEEFFEMNVKGTERLVDFACEGRLKDLHHISTMSTGSGSVKDKNDVVFTEKDCDVGQISDNYYISTKLEAEKAVIAARKRGINTCIYRVGNLVFNSANGMFQKNIGENGFYNIIRSFVGMGAMPSGGNWNFEFSFIDHASRALILLVFAEAMKNETFHVYNPNTLDSTAMREFITSLGYNMPGVDMPDFLDRLYENRENPEFNAYAESFMLHSHIFESADETKFHIVSDKTLMLLEKMGFEWPKADKMHIEKMFRHCIKTGFIKAGKSIAVNTL